MPNAPVPGPDGDMKDLQPGGLSDVSDDLVRLLPESCRAAFEQARKDESGWRGKWGGERRDGARAEIEITYQGSLY